MCSWPQKRCLNRAVHGKTWQKVIFLKLDKSIKDFSLFILLSLKYKCDPHQTKIVLFVWLRSYHVVLGNSQCAPLLLPCNDANTNKEPSLSDFTRVGFQGNIKLFVKLSYITLHAVHTWILLSRFNSGTSVITKGSLQKKSLTFFTLGGVKIGLHYTFFFFKTWSRMA